MLRTSGSRLKSAYEWKPPFHAYYPVIACFFLSNVFLVFAPLIPPAAGFRPYAHLPYWVSDVLLLIDFCSFMELILISSSIAARILWIRYRYDWSYLLVCIM